MTHNCQLALDFCLKDVTDDGCYFVYGLVSINSYGFAVS